MGLKKNIVFNSILTVSQYIIGIITFPYITRILGANNIGIISFVDNTINYFILFSTMGINIIGAREIAKTNKTRTQLNNVFSNLFYLSLIYTIIVIVIYLLAINFIDELSKHKELFYFGIGKILFSTLLIEWFFKGIENFKYITTRNIIIKIIYTFSIFIFIKEQNDYKLYLILTITTFVINGITNITYARKFASLVSSNIKLHLYLKQTLYIGSYAILTSMYTTFNIMYLGFVSSPNEVAYYWAALKIYTIILGFFTAFSTVLMSRMSSIISQNRQDEFNELINKSFSLLFSIAFPLIIFCVIYANEIVFILSGEEFLKAKLPMQIIMPLLIIVGIAQIYVMQVLMPMQKDKLILKASIIGALVGLLCNYILVEKYGSIGTSIVLAISEITVTLYYTIHIKNLIKIPYRKMLNELAYSMPYLIICILAKLFITNYIYSLIISMFILGIYFIINQIYIKNINHKMIQ